MISDFKQHNYIVKESLISGKAADIEEFRSVVTREKGDNYKNRHGVTVIL